jgi:hypothetical protein
MENNENAEYEVKNTQGNADDFVFHGRVCFREYQ